MGISRQAIEQIYRILRPAVRAGDRVRVSSLSVFAQLRDMGLAREIINPILDLVIEGLVPRTNDDECLQLPKRRSTFKSQPA